MVETEHWQRVVDEYCEGVLSGETIAGRLVVEAVKRHRNDLKRAKKKSWPYRFDKQKAVQAIMFFGFLKHTDGEYVDQPFALFPWQAFVVWCLFGWVKKATGFRRFKYAFLSMGRGNGKSPFGAALLLLVFAFDSPMEARAECFTTATKKRQAAITFDQVSRYVQKSEPLTRYVRTLAHNLSIPLNHSSLEKLSADGKTSDGLNIHGMLRDELHEWGGKQQRKFLEKLNTAMGKRRQPLCIDITTAGNEESEIWREIYDYACLAVDQGTKIEADDRFVMIFEMDDEDDELDETSWYKANPMLEHGIVKIDYLRSLAEHARYDATKRGELRRYHCNKFTTSAKMPITPELWSKGNADLPELTGKKCYAGFDWGWKDDLSALGLVFPLNWVKVSGDQEQNEPAEQWKRRYAVVLDAWICSGGKRDLTREPWRTWIAEGYLNVTDSEWTDTAAIYETVKARRKVYSIRSIAFDPNNAREFGSTCVNEFGLETFEFYQTCRKYNEPIRELIQAINEGRIIHGGNPLLAWAACNLVTKEDAEGLLMPAKKRAQDKIDPIVAVLMGLSEAMFGEKEKPSIYETRGPIVG